ncbi:hypothetical protein B0T19DRAFT_11140 [Cercophora scortea]|uniref:Uncharacterized protein n=1 Tax=Cercophora scortea TaxID=314031 RepID=A0AAE0J276_9PEZI|nr:hypothetical protein B0T19DRAFT_11140 [Cercophora scortea]
MSRGKTEILVHITAPSKAVDDEAYRVLAGAYLDFDPGRRTAVFGPEDSPSEIDRDQDEAATQRASSPIEEDIPPQVILESPVMSFRSVCDNLESPRLRRLRDREETQRSQLSWQAPPSVVQDSVPENHLAIPGYCSPTRILEHFLSTIESSQATDQSPVRHQLALRPSSDEQVASQSTSQSRYEGPINTHGSFSHPLVQPLSPIRRSRPTSPENPKAAEQSSPYPASQDNQAESSPISLPSTDRSDGDEQTSAKVQDGPNSSNGPGSIRETAEERETVIPLSPVMSRKRIRFPGPSIDANETRIVSSFPGELIPSSRSESEPPTKRIRKSPLPDPGKPLARSASDIGPRQERAKAQNKTALPALGASLEIYSPAPPTDVRDIDPDDLIPDALAQLANQLSLEKRFVPESQTRELRAFERGFWLVDCTSWSSELKHACWKFLSDYLLGGSAGWGVWCGRDGEFSRLKMWCYGHAVGHIYLLLRLASKRMVKQTGACWIDAREEVVIRMAGQPHVPIE